MLEQYEELYGPLPTPTPTPEPLVVAEIDETGGEEPPADVAAVIQNYEEQLHAKALFVCTDEAIRFDVQTISLTSVYEVWLAEELPASEEVGYTQVEAEFNAYLQQQAAAGFNVDTRAPTLPELMEQYPGCLTGEYRPD